MKSTLVFLVLVCSVFAIRTQSEIKEETSNVRKTIKAIEDFDVALEEYNNLLWQASERYITRGLKNSIITVIVLNIVAHLILAGYICFKNYRIHVRFFRREELERRRRDRESKIRNSLAIIAQKMAVRDGYIQEFHDLLKATLEEI